MNNKCENCGKCCLMTEMILSKQDIDRITNFLPQELKDKEFVINNDDGFFQLKNEEGHCVFLDFRSKQCTIYKDRPHGCRFYPLIYDFKKKKCIFDDDCPRTHLFYQTNQKLKTTCKNLRNFVKHQLNINLN